MSSGLQRRRVAGGGGGDGVSAAPTTSRPDLSNQNSFQGRSGRNSPAGPRETINAIDSSASDHRIAFDPRDMEEGEERLKFPKLTMMEEVLLLGLKDKQVPKSPSPLQVLSSVVLGGLARWELMIGLPVVLER